MSTTKTNHQIFKFNFQEMVEWYDDEKDNDLWFDLEHDEYLIHFQIVNGQKYEKMSEKRQRKNHYPQTVGRKQGNLTHFYQIDNDYSHIRKIQFVSNPSYFPNGIFYVKQDENNVFFVFPFEKTIPNGQRMIACDHFSLPLKNGSIVAHMTTYTPNPLNIEVGQISHDPREKIVDGCEMPLFSFSEGQGIFKSFTSVQENLLDLCRKYAQGVSGGQPNNIRKVEKKKNKIKNRRVSVNLEQLFAKLHVRQVDMFGIYDETDEQWHIFTSITKLAKSKLDQDFMFKIKGERERERERPSFTDIQTSLIKNIELLIGKIN